MRPCEWYFRWLTDTLFKKEPNTLFLFHWLSVHCFKKFIPLVYFSLYSSSPSLFAFHVDISVVFWDLFMLKKQENGVHHMVHRCAPRPFATSLKGFCSVLNQSDSSSLCSLPSISPLGHSCWCEWVWTVFNSTHTQWHVEPAGPWARVKHWAACSCRVTSLSPRHTLALEHPDCLVASVYPTFRISLPSRACDG